MLKSITNIWKFYLPDNKNEPSWKFRKYSYIKYLECRRAHKNTRAQLIENILTFQKKITAMATSMREPWLMENGNVKVLTRERHGRTAQNMSSSSLRKKSDMALVSRVPCSCLRKFLANLQVVILGTKLSVLFPAIPLAIIAHYFGFGKVNLHSFLLLLDHF